MTAAASARRFPTWRTLALLALVFACMVPLDHLTDNEVTKYWIHLPTYYLGLVTLICALWLSIWRPSTGVLGSRKWAMRGSFILAAGAAFVMGFIEGELVSYYPIGLLVAVFVAIPALVIGAFIGSMVGFVANVLFARRSTHAV